MGWVLVILFLGFTFNSLPEATHGKKHPYAVIVGTVYCDTCFQQMFSKNSHLISGASVAVECKDDKSRLSFSQVVKTDRHGEFEVHLPFSVGKHVKKIKRCSVKLLSSGDHYCVVASTATSSSLHLKSREQRLQIFSAGFFSFKPEKQPNFCNQKQTTVNAEKTSLPPLPPLQDPDLTPVKQNYLPPLPLLPRLPPLPQLPPLPSLPGIPFLPPIPGESGDKKTRESSDNKHLSDQIVNHPEEIFPPPPLFPSSPLQPLLIPPPSIPTVLPQASPSTFIPSLLVPGQIAPPPTLPVQLPVSPVPSPTASPPSIAGIPLASSSSSSSP